MPSPKPDPRETAPMLALRKFANGLPEAEEGTSCVNRAFRARNKAYAYLGIKGDRYKLMLKLVDSLAQAEALQDEDPDTWRVGKGGWTTVWLPLEERAPKGLLESWIEESYRALVHPSLVAQLPKRRAKKQGRR
ncbi:MAG: MmcQ/YjbR family DNA-binding protein [Planctomycetota bacterium]